MKKKLLIGGGAAVVLAVGAAVAYWFFIHEEQKAPRYVRDPKAWEVPPVAYAMKGKTFVVPEVGASVVLDRISPGTKYDYPMGVFAVATGTGEGRLVALDEFTTDLSNGRRAVPIVVTQAGTGEQVYLAVVEESEASFVHVASHYLGDRIRINKVTRDGDAVTVDYHVHDRNQAMAEVPLIQTAAIIDIATGQFVQEGRKPWLDAMQEAKQFAGVYQWQKTTKADGAVVTPSKPDVFTLTFDGPRAALGTDCNTGSSEVTLPVGTSTAISFGPVAATRLFCQSSEEQPYFDMFTKVTTYKETGSGLELTLSDGGTMEFVKAGQTLEFEAATEAGGETSPDADTDAP